MIEWIEPRKLFATIGVPQVVVQLGNGMLEIIGTPGNDHVRLTRANAAGAKIEGTLVSVRANGKRYSFQIADVNEIRIATGDGDDSIRSDYFSSMSVYTTHTLNGKNRHEIRWSGPPTSIDAGAGNDAVTGGPATETIRGGTGKDTLVGGGGNDLIRGGEGRDVLFNSRSRGERLVGDAGIDTYVLLYNATRIDFQSNDIVDLRRGGRALTLSGEPAVFPAMLPNAERGINTVIDEMIDKNLFIGQATSRTIV